MKDNLSSKRTILDYTPAFNATAEVAKGLVVYIDKLPADLPYEKDESPDHLRWMISEIVSNAQTQAEPVDKLSRWLGYVQGTLRAHRVLDTVAERDRTRPIFHRAYIEMGVRPPETKHRLDPIDAVFERPDLDALVHEWSFPFRHYLIASFMRGLTRLGSIKDDLPLARVSSLYHHAIFTGDHGYLRRAVSLGEKEAEFRFAFFEQFMERVRSDELRALSRGRYAYLAGTATFAAFYALCILLIANNAQNVTAVAGIVAVAVTAYTLAVAAQVKMRRLRNKAAQRLKSFRKALPWKEEDISGIAIIDDMTQPST